MRAAGSAESRTRDYRVPNSNRTVFGATNQDYAKCSHQTPTHHCDFSVGSTVRLYFRRELALAQSLFDRLFSAIDPLPMGLVGTGLF